MSGRIQVKIRVQLLSKQKTNKRVTPHLTYFVFKKTVKKMKKQKVSTIFKVSLINYIYVSVQI